MQDSNKWLSVAEVIVLLCRKWKLLFAIGLITAIISYLVIYFGVTPKYRASALVVPIEQNNSFAPSNLLKGISNIPISLDNFGGGNSQQVDFFITVMYSRTTLNFMIEKFNLQNRYKQKYKSRTIEALKKNVSLDITDEGGIVIAIIDKDPKFAANMVNTLLDYVNSKVIELNMAKAEENREFLENRYREIASKLEKAEDSIAAFQGETNMLEVESQLKTSIDAYSRLESDIVQKEIQKSVYEQYLTPNAPQLKMLETEIAKAKRKLQSMKEAKDPQTLLFPLKGLPVQAKKYLRLRRDVEIYSNLMKVVLPIFEQAKYEEQKSIPVIQVIDRAVPPDRKFAPSRTMLAGMIAISTVFLACFVIIMRRLSTFVEEPAKKKILKTLRLSSSNE